MPRPAEQPLERRHYIRFPPASTLLALPVAPRRASLAGLALYDTVAPRQRAMLAVATALGRAGLLRVLPRNRAPEVDWDWWGSLIREVAEPLVGHVAHVAWRRHPRKPRHGALLMDVDGKPLAFTKTGTPPEGSSADVAARLLAAASLTTFRVPARLAAGVLDGVRYEVVEPLPEGPHHEPPFDAAHLWSVVDEYRGTLEQLPSRQEAEAHHVPVHGDFQVRNLRQASDGSWWLFDWDNVHRGPQLADELRFWVSAFSSRAPRRIDRHAAVVLDLLRRRGSDAEVLEALRWPLGQPTRSEQRALYAAVERQLAGG